MVVLKDFNVLVDTGPGTDYTFETDRKNERNMTASHINPEFESRLDESESGEMVLEMNII